MTTPRPIKLVILKERENYKSMTFNDLAALLLKSYEALRPSVLEILRSFESEGLFCPTVTCDRKNQEITLIYDSWAKGSTRKLEINFSHQDKIEYRYGSSMWIPTTIDGLKKRPKDIKGWLGNERPSSNAAS